MTKAKIAAWNVYMARVQTVVEQQHREFEAGRWPNSISIAPPTQKHVEIIQAAIDTVVCEVRDSLIHEVLAPIVSALDAIDNSRTKNDTVKACREKLQKVYDEMHAIKNRKSPSPVDPALEPE